MHLSLRSGRRRGTLVVAALLATLTAAGTVAAVATASSSGKQAKDSLVVLEEEVAPTLDVDGPNGAQPQTQEMIDNLMDPLVTYRTKLQNKVLIPNYNITQTQFLPRLASSYTKQGKVFTFKLRHGVKSCAGNELTADDVVWTFQRAISLTGTSPLAWFLANTGGVFDLRAVAPKATAKDKTLQGEVTKVDKYTVRFNQRNPSELFPRVLSIFGLYIYDSVEMKKHATASDPWAHQYTLQQDTPGFGAYCLKSWTKGSQMVLTANPNYYLGQPQFKTVTIRKVAVLANRVAAIQSGAADFMYPVTPEVVQQLLKTKNVDILSWFNNNTVSVGFNYKTPPWSLPKNALLRQAIAYALPYDAIIREDYKGQAKPWYGLIQSRYYGYFPIKKYHTDIAKAKQLLAQAGYPGGKGLEKYKSALALYYVTERSSVLEPIANRIRTALQQIGINITLAPITSVEMNTRELTKFDLPMWIRDQLQPIGTDTGYSVGVFYASRAAGAIVPSTNYTGVDKDYIAQQKVTGSARLTILKRMETRMMNDLPLVPILEYPTWFAARKGMTHLEGRPNNSVTWWWFKCPTC